jgi:hypothetical protein
MMEVFLDCGNALQGKTIPAEMLWKKDVEPIAMKCIYHLGSLYVLLEGTRLRDMVGVPIRFIDFPSMALLTRAAFETYLTFHYIFVNPATDEEKSFRSEIWTLGGLKDRKRFVFTSPEGHQVLLREQQQIAELEQRIRSNPLFLQLPEPRQREAIKGKWRFDKHWRDLAVLADTHKDYFTSLYAYLSSYAHTGYLSILQLSQATTAEEQNGLAGMYIGIGLSIMSNFILGYCSLFPEAQAVLEGNDEYRYLVDVYHFTAKAWEQNLQKGYIIG